MDISSVQKLCIHLISSAYQRCRLSEDLCRLSVVLESTLATPIVRVSISDTGTGSCLEEFQDLKYSREGLGTEKWDGLLSIKTTTVPAFGILGKKSFFFGQVGNGAKMKLVVNMIMASMMIALSEGLVLADRSGLNPHDLLDVLDLGAIANPMFKGKGPAMLQNNYSPGCPLKHAQKDMRLALALGDENALPMPVAAAASEAFKKAISMGLGDLDFSAVFETVKLLKHSS